MFHKNACVPSANCKTNFRELQLRERLSLKGTLVSHNCPDNSVNLNQRTVVFYDIMCKIFSIGILNNIMLTKNVIIFVRTKYKNIVRENIYSFQLYLVFFLFIMMISLRRITTLTLHNFHDSFHIKYFYIEQLIIVNNVNIREISISAEYRCSMISKYIR